MRLWFRESSSYAVLLIILFSIAAIAVWQTILYLEGQMPSRDDFHVLTVILWTLTLGFMSIAGAFGLWAIRFSAEAESRRRIGLLVDAMDYLSDGLAAVDRKGRITGANPALWTLTDAAPDKRRTLKDLFDCLSDEDLELLQDRKEPREVEHTASRGETSRTLRFRSQPSESLSLVLVSDVTATNAQKLRGRQRARLQLIGQLARGVAHDFSNILCAISGYASLLSRLPPGSPDGLANIRSISERSERGMALAGHLLELSHPRLTDASCARPGDHVRNAAALLRDGLPERWQVRVTAQDGLPAVALSPLQIEQVVLNLGWLVTDACLAPGILEIEAGRPGTDALFQVQDRFAAAIFVSARQSGSESPRPFALVAAEDTDAGAIQSVIRSIVEEAGGRLERLAGTGGMPAYRVCLPRGAPSSGGETVSPFPLELGSYIAEWAILIGGPGGPRQDRLAKRLADMGARPEAVQDIAAALGRIEAQRNLDALILDERMLGEEATAVLKAILRLRPAAAVVVSSENPDALLDELAGRVVVVPDAADPNRILAGLIEARSLAARRQQAGRSVPRPGMNAG